MLGFARNSIGLGSGLLQKHRITRCRSGRLTAMCLVGVRCVIQSASEQGELRIHRKRRWPAPKGLWGIALLASQTYNVITMLILDGALNANHAEKNW